MHGARANQRVFNLYTSRCLGCPIENKVAFFILFLLPALSLLRPATCPMRAICIYKTCILGFGRKNSKMSGHQRMLRRADYFPPVDVRLALVKANSLFVIGYRVSRDVVSVAPVHVLVHEQRTFLKLDILRTIDAENKSWPCDAKRHFSPAVWRLAPSKLHLFLTQGPGPLKRKAQRPA
ncbi:hypothetical protein BKA80DRAFT_76527 [Phyllosticta citrichinensis]